MSKKIVKEQLCPIAQGYTGFSFDDLFFEPAKDIILNIYLGFFGGR